MVERGLKTKHPLYWIWAKVKERCYSPTCSRYPYYGGRGITMQESWRKDFYAFVEGVGPRPSKSYSLERIDNDVGYCEGNVKWATDFEQARNKSMYSSNTTGITGVNYVEKKPGQWYYIAVWEQDGKQVNRVFSVNKYGKDEAFKLACEVRSKEIEKLKQSGEYSENHGNKRKVLNGN